MTYSTLVSSLENNIFIVTINRPEKLNALNGVVLAELALAVEEIYNNPSIKSAIITGAGPKAFVAGADISEFFGLTKTEAMALSKRGQDLFFKIVRFHYQLDIVDRRKLKEEFEMFRIAQILVDKEYAKKNIRFYVNINRIKRKIDGKFSPKMFTQAVKDYLQENEHAVKLISNKKDDYGNRLYNYNQAFNKAILDKFEKYYGNN